MGILDDILTAMRLTDSDRAALKAKRGFTDETIDRAVLRSCGPFNRDIIKAAAEVHGDDVLVQAGVMYWTKAGKARINAPLLEEGRVCIPYFRGGAAAMLRPHQRQPKDKSVIPFAANDGWDPTSPTAGMEPYTCYDPQRVTVVAEGEFKAMAARQYGFQAVSVQGISTFIGGGFEALLECLERYDIRNIAILYDNEDRSNPASPRYQSNAQSRYAVQYAAWRLAQMLNANDRIRLSARVATIPDHWRDAGGKIDIDGLLAANCRPEQFAEMVNGALSPDDYIRTLPAEAVALLNKRHGRELGWERDIRVIERRGIYTYLTEDQGPQPISNFLAEYIATHAHADGTRTWWLELTNTDGEKTPMEFAGREVADWKRFRSACAAHGKYFWSGRDSAIEDLWHLVVPSDEKVVHLRPRAIGWDDELNHWMFTNCAVDAHGRVVDYESDGSIVLDGTRYAAIDDGGDLPEAHFAAGGSNWDRAGLRDLAGKLASNFDCDDVVMALAWTCAVALKPWLFPINRTFPILFVFGRKGSGKTRLMQWLTRVFFNREAGTETLIGQNSPAFIRNRAAQLSYLPLWLDEYRNSDASARHLDVLRGIYDHSSAGISGGTIGTNKTFRLNCALVVSGEDEPDDPTGALNERMISVRIPDKISGRHFALIEQMQYSFDGIFTWLLRERERLVPAIQAHYEQLVERHRRAGVGNRVAINYALMHAVSSVVLDWHFSDDRIAAAFDELTVEAAEAEPISDLLLTVGALGPRFGDINLEHALMVRPSSRTGQLCLLFNFRSCVQAYAVAKSRSGQRASGARTLRKLMRTTPWVSRESHPYRVEGQIIRCHEVSLDLAPPSLVELAHNRAEGVERDSIASRYGGDLGPLATTEV